MKMNFDFYSGSDFYSDGEIEKEIISYIEKYGEENIEEVFKTDIRWPIFYHLTPIRRNIINWYPFKDNADVLEIGAGMGAITSTLCKKAKSVTAIELSKQRATAIAKRNENKENLEIIVANLNDVKFTRKFDYITLIGVLEYASLYTKSNNPFNDFLNNIKSFLKPDGKLLIAIENQFGLKYFEGAVEDHTNIKYDGIVGYKNKNGVRTFGKIELKRILKDSGFMYQKFYYPLPDYKLPNIVFSDEYLPNENTILEYTPYYYEGTELEFNEKEAYKEIIKNDMFGFFSNSFFVECSMQKIDTSVDFSKVEFEKISDVSYKFYDKDYSKKMVNFEENKMLKEEIKNLNSKINAITNSRSWKITQPFRNINNKLKM